MKNINELLIKKIEQYTDYMIKQRRHFHKNPELSGKEFNTSKYLKNEIRKLNLPIYEVKGTGFYSILDTEKKGKTIGIRTDIDALPIVENFYNLKSQKKCISLNSGIMHACGHDAHMSILLCVAKILTEIKNELVGKIIFIFEEGEETGSGIHSMIEAIKNIKFDAIYATHVTSFMDIGKISATSGPVMAGTVGMNIKIKGKGGHGSRPDKSINPIFAGANIISNLASAWVNQLDVTKTTTLGIGSFHSGTAANIIPDEATIEGTIRFYDNSNGEKALEIIKNISETIAKAHNCTVELNEKNKILVAPVVNDTNLSKLAENSINSLFPEALEKDITWFASESFSFYNKLSPILLVFAGIRNSEFGSGAEHHNEYFDIDEKVLSYASLLTLKFVYEFLKNSD